jgi:hypothetical protein
MPESIQQQVERNFKAFQEILPAIAELHRGKFALMRDGEIIEYFDTARDAYVAGQKIFKEDLIFSIQEVVDTPIDLGFFSHALHQR